MDIELIPPEVWEIGILNKDYHGRLLADAEHLTNVAGIPLEFLWSRLSTYCTGKDVAWVKNLKRGKVNGLVFIGKYPVPIESKMMAITAACMRNYIDARMMPVQEVIQRIKKDDMPTPTVLLIPNFCMEKTNGGEIPLWQVSSLLGLLYSRLAHGLKTVIYVGSLETLEADYGSSFVKHVQAHYETA